MNKEIVRKEDITLWGIITAELIALSLVILITISPYIEIALADAGEDNVTLVSLLEIGNAFPEIVNITVNNGNGIDLTPNSTTQVNVVAIIRDFNTEIDIVNVSSEFFDNSASSYGSGNDNNNHYTNNTCTIDTSYGDGSEINATCTFFLEYYANNASWNATISVRDTLNAEDIGSEIGTVNTLLALGLPSSIDYGEINATAVSQEIQANITNFGNVRMNLSLSGYGATEGDGNAMNCTLGATRNISIEHEKYNVTSSISGNLDLSQFEGNYSNLSASPIVNEFNLNFRQNDTDAFVDDTNSTYWRIYVPLGVAGTCSGNIIFGAVQGPTT